MVSVYLWIGLCFVSCSVLFIRNTDLSKGSDLCTDWLSLLDSFSLLDLFCIRVQDLNVWRSSYKGRMVDALGQEADEGRSKRRNASERCKQPMTRRYPNGETRDAMHHTLA